MKMLKELIKFIPSSSYSRTFEQVWRYVELRCLYLALPRVYHPSWYTLSTVKFHVIILIIRDLGLDILNLRPIELESFKNTHKMDSLTYIRHHIYINDKMSIDVNRLALVKSGEEAFYICGMLNIPELYKSVKMISDTRHHHKRPLYFNIPKFTSSNDQLKIAAASKVCRDQVNLIVENNEKTNENEIFSLIEGKLRKIQDLGLKILKSSESQEIVKEYMLK